MPSKRSKRTNGAQQATLPQIFGSPAPFGMGMQPMMAMQPMQPMMPQVIPQMMQQTPVNEKKKRKTKETEPED